VALLTAVAETDPLYLVLGRFDQVDRRHRRPSHHRFMAESSPIDEIEPLIVTADDGTLFHLSAMRFGGANAPYPTDQRLRWHVMDTAGRSYVGPPILDREPEAAQQAISDWWRQHKPVRR